MNNYVEYYEISKMNDQSLIGLSKKLNLGLSLKEMKLIKKYYTKEKKISTDVELQVIAQEWSEHCSYKSSKIYLKKYIFPVNFGNVVYKGDAGVLKFDKEHYYAIRIESHNHPSNVEPYGGAATGIGGIIRDVLSVGAKPIALADPLFFPPVQLDKKDIPQGTINPRLLVSGVVAGIRDYGNRVGIPTIAGSISFDKSYIGNALVNVGCVGFLSKKELIKNNGNEGDLLILLGGLTGRDGIHGVSFASVSLYEKSTTESRSAVQVGDPITKEPLIRAIRELTKNNLISGMKDLGGGGLSTAASEFAFNSNCGMRIDLTKVPLKESDMLPWEIFISESQERMLISIKKRNLKKVKDIIETYGVRYTIIGEFTKDKNAVATYKGDIVFNLRSEFLLNPPLYKRSIKKREKVKIEEHLNKINLEELIVKIISDPNVRSKEHVIRQYDHEVQGISVLKPLSGYPNKEGVQDASVLKPNWDSWRGLAIAVGSAHRIAKYDPYIAGNYAVYEVTSNLVSIGSMPEAITNCINAGNPENPYNMYDFIQTVKGISDASKRLKISIPSGNVSLYNDFKEKSIPPTAVLLGTGIVEDIRKIITTCFKKEENPLYMVGKVHHGLAGSIAMEYIDGQSNKVPMVSLNEFYNNVEKMREAMKKRYVLSAHDISDGGAIATLTEMAICSQKGFELNNSLEDYDLISESPGRWIVEVNPETEQEFKNIMKSNAIKIGKVDKKYIATFNEKIRKDISELDSIWREEVY